MDLSFKDRIYELAKQIPRGKVATYGQLAKLAGKPKAARTVGVIMKHNPFAPVVPCHRVVGSKGDLVGFSAGDGLASKKKLLKEEGVAFIKDRVDLTLCLWQKKF